MVRAPASRVAAVGAIAVTALAIGGCATTPRTTGDGDRGDALTGVSRVERVGQLSGAKSPGRTDRYAAGYMDLGSMFEADGRVWFVFGDTFGDRPADATGGGGSFWRSNVLGYTSDDDPSDGIRLDGMVTDDSGSAKELLASKKVDGVEMTVIPTHGFEADGAMYLHFMSVRHWGEPGEWEVNYAGLAKSTDEGHHWTKLAGVRWAGDSGFVQISPFHVTEAGVDWIYVWGITHGRFGGVSLARVKASEVEDERRWQYFAGADHGIPNWVNDVHAARIVLDDTVGELSVVWNDYLGRWIMTYLAEGRGVVIRDSPTPWGPWGDEHVLVSDTEVPGLYAPYMLPRYTADGGRTIYFTLSIWDPYNVFWYRAELEKG